MTKNGFDFLKFDFVPIFNSREIVAYRYFGEKMAQNKIV